MPKPGTFTEFKNTKNMLKVPYVIDADFESVIETGCRSEKKGDKTTLNGKHVPSSFALACIRSDGKLMHVQLYRGKGNDEQNIMTRFSQALNTVHNIIQRQREAPMEITALQKEEFSATTECYLCQRPPKKITV